MTDVHFTDTRLAVIRLTAAALLRAPLAIAAGISRRAMAAARARRDAALLMSLSDSHLKDIGIGRGEIERLVRTGRRD